MVSNLMKGFRAREYQVQNCRSNSCQKNVRFDRPLIYTAAKIVSFKKNVNEKACGVVQLLRRLGWALIEVGAVGHAKFLMLFQLTYFLHKVMAMFHLLLATKF